MKIHLRKYYFLLAVFCNLLHYGVGSEIRINSEVSDSTVVEIFFMDYFKDDTVDVIFEDSIILGDMILNTERSTQLSGLYLELLNFGNRYRLILFQKNLRNSYENQSFKKVVFEIDELSGRTLNLQVVVNGKLVDLVIPLYRDKKFVKIRRLPFDIMNKDSLPEFTLSYFSERPSFR